MLSYDTRLPTVHSPHCTRLVPVLDHGSEFKPFLFLGRGIVKFLLFSRHFGQAFVGGVCWPDIAPGSVCLEHQPVQGNSSRHLQIVFGLQRAIGMERVKYERLRVPVSQRSTQ